MSELIFQSGPISVTRSVFRFARRQYRLPVIENMILKRPLLLMGFAVAALLAGFAEINDDILYPMERQAPFALAVIIPIVAWPWGTLTIHSRTLGTTETITWFYEPLKKAQNAAEGANASRHSSGDIDQDLVR